MATTTDFRNGFVMRIDGELWTISEFQHVKPGKGGAFVRTKIKNVKTGRVLEKTFRSGEKVEDVRLEKRPYQYLYQEGASYVFMNTNTYEQAHVPEEVLGDKAQFLKDGMDVEILFNGDEALGVDLPIFVTLEIVHSEPGLKGDTATNVTKPATMETGAIIHVPLFVEQGDRIKIDTRTGEYVERVK